MNVKIGLGDFFVTPKSRNPKEVRVCGDYRQANKAVKRKRHPIPTVKELMDNMDEAVKNNKVIVQRLPSYTPCQGLAVDYNFYNTSRTISIMQFKELSKD